MSFKRLSPREHIVQIVINEASVEDISDGTLAADIISALYRAGRLRDERELKPEHDLIDWRTINQSQWDTGVTAT